MMRKLFTCGIFLLLPLFAHAQTGTRWDLGAPGSAGAVTIGGTGLSPILALPNVQLNWCNHPANASPCTNFATTYTSITLATPCGNNTQVVLQGSNTCQATGDNFGDIGVYTATNTTCGGSTCYDYTLTVNGQSLGPYVWAPPGGSGSGTGTLQDPGANGPITRYAPTLTRPSVASEIAALFCVGGGLQGLFNDGACHPAGTGDLTSAPSAGTSQTVAQIPSAGGTPSTFAVNNLNNTRTVPVQGSAATTTGYNWQQSPSGTITAGATTVTLPNGCPPGIAVLPSPLNGPVEYLFISDGGSSEYVLVTATTCNLHGGNAGTVTFTAANNHSAGYKIGSASQGTQETILDGCIQSPSFTTIRLFSKVVIPPGDPYTWGATVTEPCDDTTIDMSGAVINTTMTNGPGLYIGTNGSHFTSGVTILNPTFRTQSVNTNAAIEDNGQKTTVIGFRPFFTGNATFSYGELFLNDNDQGPAVVDGMDTSLMFGDGFGPCTATSCPVAIKGAASGTNAGITAVKNSNLTLGCLANGIDNGVGGEGNTFSVTDSVVQGYPEFGIRYRGTFPTAGLNLSGVVYEEIGSCTNPQMGGLKSQAGLIAQGGNVNNNSTAFGVGQFPSFYTTATPSAAFVYYVVGHSTTLGVTNVLLAGSGTTTGAGSGTIVWPQMCQGNGSGGSCGTVTYDVLKVPAGQITIPISPKNVIPTGTATIALATGISGSCSNGACSTTDSGGALSSYTVATQTWNDSLLYWPGSIVLTGITENTAWPFTSLYYTSTVDQSIPVSSVTPIYSQHPSAFSLTCGGQPSAGSLFWYSCPASDPVAGNGANNGVFAMGNGSFGSAWAKANPVGRQVFVGYGMAMGPSDIITLQAADNGLSIFANPNTRPTAAVNDCAVGSDNAASSTNYGLAFRCKTSISQYIASLGDGSSWLERLTASLKSFTVPVNGTSAAWSSTNSAAGFILTTGALSTSQIANAGTTGTTLNKLAKLSGAPSAALIAATTDTSGILGVCIAGCGTTSSATIALQGIASCVFDGATTAGDYVQISSSTAGDCHDTAASYPTSGQVIGRVMTSNGGGGTYSLALNIDIEGFSGSGSSTLAGLTDVCISAPSDTQVLTYSLIGTCWKNANPSVSVPTFQVNGTPLASSTTITLNSAPSPFNGLTVTASNPSLGIEQLGLSGLLTVPGGGLGLSAGVSGGVPCYTTTTTAASSALLAANQIMFGGGAGVCPTTANLSGDVVSSGASTTIQPNVVNSSKMAVANTYRVCGIVIGSDNPAGAALASADIAPQTSQCFIPAAATVVEVDVYGDAGTPAVTVAKKSGGSTTNLTTSLSTAAAGARACANVGGGSGIGSGPTCSSTLSVTSLAAGDVLLTNAAVADGVARSMKIFITYTVN